jgi:dTDP-4-amino-4,6-dideoxy-D-galactose acyltransferase
VRAVEPLPWDSEFFGLAVARLHPDRLDGEPLRAATKQADEDGLECLYLLVTASDTGRLAEAQALGFRVYDVRVELDGPAAATEAVDVRPGREDDRPWLDGLARRRFSDTRFYADPHFPRERVADLYVAWLDRAYSAAGRSTLVTNARDGFVVVAFDEGRETGTIELIAVDEAATGRGAGSRLVIAAGAAAAAAGLHAMRVVTQGANVAAQRLYQRHGYRTTETDLWLHRWRSD